MTSGGRRSVGKEPVVTTQVTFSGFTLLSLRSVKVSTVNIILVS